MIGNASEEGVMLQLEPSSHLDAGRIAVPAGGVLGLVLFLTLQPFVGAPVAATLAFAAFAALAAGLYRHLNASRARRAAAESEDRRATREIETQKRIAEMKRSATS